METPFRVFSLYYNTIKYLRPIQIYGRLAQATRSRTQRLLGGLLPRRALQDPVVSLRETAASERWSAWAAELGPAAPTTASVEALLQNRFCFLNREIAFGDRIAWRAGDQPKLWRYHLHYFDYLLDLASAYTHSGDRRYAHKIMQLMADWIAQNPPGVGDGWEPYPVSLRIVNWIKMLALAQTQDDGWLAQALACADPSPYRSLYQQAAFLARNVEYHLLGNHLIKNAKALLFAGLFFTDAAAERWRATGLQILTEQLGEQILDDGGHFERSPMYHSLVLDDYLDSWALIDRFGLERADRARWTDKIARMASFLDAIVHPDGQIPLFNDSALGMAPEPGALLARAERLIGRRLGVGTRTPAAHVQALPDSGYFTIASRDGADKMILDCGPIGPDYLPGHAHCDTLSFELSHQGERRVVDTGVFEYRPGALRAYSRSTRAHNTIAVDGLEQSEVWSSFRVGRRAKPLAATLEDQGDVVCFTGSHDGYLRAGGVRHTRRVYLVDEAFWVISDRIEGAGRHRIDGFVHLHPDVRVLGVARQPAACEVMCRPRTGADLCLRFLPPCAVAVEDSLYFPEFGKQVDNQTVHYFHTGVLPLHLIYLIAPAALDLAWQPMTAADGNGSAAARWWLQVWHQGRRRILSC